MITSSNNVTNLYTSFYFKQLCLYCLSIVAWLCFLNVCLSFIYVPLLYFEWISFLVTHNSLFCLLTISVSIFSSRHFFFCGLGLSVVKTKQFLSHFYDMKLYITFIQLIGKHNSLTFHSNDVTSLGIFLWFSNSLKWCCNTIGEPIPDSLIGHSRAVLSPDLGI